MIVLSVNLTVECENPGKPVNGTHYYTSTAIGQTVTYGCNDGLVISGNSRQTCLETGLWSGSVPVCKCM